MKNLKQRPEVSLDKRDFATQLAEAELFFNDPGLGKTKNLEDGNNPYADKDGLIEFICGVELQKDPIVSAKLAELKALLISMTTVVTAYINRKGPKSKTDPELWAEAISHLPLMGSSKIDTQSYSRKTRGVEIAGDFINLVLDIATKEGNALNTFKSFLEKQGNALRAGISENKDYYKTITIGISVEVFKVGNEIVYAPKIKQYQVDFSRENSRWSSSCASYEEIEIHFNYMYAANVFDYEALSDPDTRKKFDKFIKSSQQAQIEDASTFFNSDFEAKEEKKEVAYQS